MRTQLKREEKLLLITRQHWMTLIIPFIACIVIISLLFYFMDPTLALMIALGLLLVPGYLYLEWKHNLWAVTNLRVIDESGFFTRYSKESPLEKINNVEFTQGIFGRMFGYGNVEIQTAAEVGNTHYTMIQDPKHLKDTITHAQEEYKGTHLKNQAQQLADAIKLSMPASTNHNISVSDEIEKLFGLLQKGAITHEEYIMQKNKLLNK